MMSRSSSFHMDLLESFMPAPTRRNSASLLFGIAESEHVLKRTEEREESELMESSVAPYVCDSLSSPLIPLMVQTDYMSDINEPENTPKEKEIADTEEAKVSEEPKKSAGSRAAPRSSNAQNTTRRRRSTRGKKTENRTKSEESLLKHRVLKETHPFYIRPEIQEAVGKSHSTPLIDPTDAIPHNEEQNVSATQKALAEQETESESDFEEVHDFPLRSSLTIKGFHTTTKEPEVEKEQETILVDVELSGQQLLESILAYDKDYMAPCVGTAYQCTIIPDMLDERGKKLAEQKNRTFNPLLVYCPLEDESPAEEQQYSKMLQTLKKMVPDVPQDVILQIYFQNNYEVFDTIAHVVKFQEALKFNTRENFSDMERSLFEAGLRQFGKQFSKIQNLIKTKKLEEIMTYYYYWRSKYCAAFLKETEQMDPGAKLLRRGRAHVVLERLQREKKAPMLPPFVVDLDSDWVKCELYPFTPEVDGSYIHVKAGLTVKPERKQPAVSRTLRKRKNLSNSIIPPAKRFKGR